MTLQRIWNDFKELAWWKKILLFVPLIVISLFVGLLAVSKGKTNEKVVAHSKKKTDTEITNFMKELDKLKLERVEVLNERKRIKQDLKNAKKNSSNFIRRIDNADASELSVLAEELRSNSTSN